MGIIKPIIDYYNNEHACNYTFLYNIVVNILNYYPAMVVMVYAEWSGFCSAKYSPTLEY